MKSEQIPKEIKAEFSSEVKETTPSEKKKKRNKRTLWVSTYLGYASFFFFCDSIYFYATTETWTDARVFFVAAFMALSILLFFASAVADSYYDFPDYKDIKRSNGGENDYDYL